MGLSGDAHIDEKDSPAYFTAVTIYSDLPPRFDPGRFFLAYPGIYCDLNYLTTIVFSGNRRHGSSPPIATADATQQELDESIRFAAVNYGSSGPTQSFHKRPIGVAGLTSSRQDKKTKKKKAILFNITPEMLDRS